MTPMTFRRFFYLLFRNMHVILKAKESQVEASKVLDMVEDIVNFLENRDAEDYETSQQCVSVGQLFRAFVVKD